jgi:hypothetical protein
MLIGKRVGVLVGGGVGVRLGSGVVVGVSGVGVWTTGRGKLV